MTEHQVLALRIDLSPFLRKLTECLKAMETMPPTAQLIDPPQWVDAVERDDHNEMMARNLMAVRPLPCTNE
ncbi:hypothetical protein P0D88_31370 [Paraburkholderia sp. RL18-103-BIB-C]|uniref:hypothetical protein n=1 Tax=Paraburkholderia sp. RL18-103-BIB-C TaxID=3031637 RepID=UPI0038B951AE